MMKFEHAVAVDAGLAPHADTSLISSSSIFFRCSRASLSLRHIFNMASLSFLKGRTQNETYEYIHRSPNCQESAVAKPF